MQILEKNLALAPIFTLDGYRFTKFVCQWVIMIYSIYLFTNPEKNNIKLLILYSYLDTLMAYVYIVKCYDDSYYTGSTKNLSERIKKHNSCKGAKYTMGRTPVILVYYEEFKNFNDALKRECAIKKLKKEEKEQLTKIIKECPL